jgi:hypothetical protein
MKATKDNRGERSNERTTAKDDQEGEFISLIPVDDEEKGHTNDKPEGQDFISLTPIDDGEEEEEETNRGGDSGNDSTEKTTTNGKRTRTFDKFNSLPPWMETYVDYRRVNPLIALHNEIVGFCKLMEPKEEEMKTREELVAKFTALVKSTFRDNCKVEVFGSQATGYVRENKAFRLYYYFVHSYYYCVGNLFILVVVASLFLFLV